MRDRVSRYEKGAARLGGAPPEGSAGRGRATPSIFPDWLIRVTLGSELCALLCLSILYRQDSQVGADADPVALCRGPLEDPRDCLRSRASSDRSRTSYAGALEAPSD